MPKDKSDPKSVFDMINSLRGRYGSAEGDTPKEDETTSKIGRAHV